MTGTTSVYLATTNGFVNVTQQLAEDVKQAIDYPLAQDFQNTMLTEKKALVWIVENNTKKAEQN